MFDESHWYVSVTGNEFTLYLNLIIMPRIERLHQSMTILQIYYQQISNLNELLGNRLHNGFIIPQLHEKDTER